MTRPAVTPDCCALWPDIAARLRWYAQEGWPDLLVMPCLDFVRVNHCPSCGKDRRDCVARAPR